jgi:imidazolonepropionase-like amidohydrolase
MITTNPRPALAGMPGSAASLWLVGGHVVDVLTGTVRLNLNVEIRDGLIASITTDPAPAGAESLDITGRFVSPGMISVHTHLTQVYPFHDLDPAEAEGVTVLRGAARARDALLAGVTTVRTLDEHKRADIAIRAAQRQGWFEGPRIFASGRSIGVTGGHGTGFGSNYADGHDGFLRAARAELAAGADHIKVFITGGIAHPGEIFNGAQMTMDEMRAAVRATQEHGTYVVAHAGGGAAILEALRAGISHFEHGYDLDEETVTTMAAHRAYLTPTLSVTSSPEWMRAHGFTEAQIEFALEVHPSHLASIQRAFAHAVQSVDDLDGIRIVAGTDYLPGEPHAGTSCAVRELEYMEQAGLPTAVVLRSTTWEAARLLGAEKEFGSIAEGLAADLVVTTEDPTLTVSALRTIGTVIAEGRVVRTDVV